ncbi:MAG: 5-methyltetrahydropteroyltriglutamate--homocysteine S-methyltransferase [Alphaproteobacteria bacterium]
MTPMTPPFRADHVGSLLRPPELLAARAAYQKGELAADKLRAIEDQAIRDAVRMQEDLGFKVATDGEMRRGSWHMDFLYQIGGVVKAETNLKIQFKNETETLEFTPPMARVAAKLRFDKIIFADDFKFLKSVTKATPKLTIPSPNMIHYRGGRSAIDAVTYPTMDQFWKDLSAVYGTELSELGKLGCTYLQIDDTSLASINDPKQRDYVASIGGDKETQHLTYIRVINDALKQKPAGMTVATHLCRGNFRSSWLCEGSYDYVAEALFGELAVDAYFLEYDDDRSGGFEPLRFIPKNKHVVLGLITTKKAALENKPEIKRRIDQAAKYVPLDRLSLSPQCGFSSTVDGNAVGYRDQVAKLRLVAEIATDVWGST